MRNINKNKHQKSNVPLFKLHDKYWRLWFKLTNIEKTSYKNIGIYNIGYITIKKIDDYENIHSVYPLYLMIGKAIRHIKEKNESKYLVFDSAVLHSMKLHSENENKEVLKNTLNFGMRLKMRLRP